MDGGESAQNGGDFKEEIGSVRDQPEKRESLLSDKKNMPGLGDFE